MNIVIQSYSTTGIRPQNEDAMEVVNNLNNNDKTIMPILYAGLFDGHGGGSISKTLVDKEKINIGKYFCNISSPIASNLSQSNKFNKKLMIPLFTRIQEKLKNFYIHSNTMGSTALITIIYPRNEKQDKYFLKIINLGDSRAIMCNNYNIANQLSLDHKPFLYCDKKRIFDLGGVLEQDTDDDIRINGMAVSRSFGDLDNKYISQIPDVFDYNLSNEKFIVMACDGVWDVLGNQEVVDFILEKYEELKSNNRNITNLKAKSEYNLAQKLAELAIKKGSEDNISITIIYFVNNL